MHIDFLLEDVTGQSFEKLMNLSPIDSHTQSRLFQSRSKPFQPLQSSLNVFGGHILAQAVYAAAKTVPSGYICHSSSSYFLRPGMADIPFLYQIELLRDGRMYSMRSVKVYQVSPDETAEFDFQSSYIRFVATISFKLPQADPLRYQSDPQEELSQQTDEVIATMEPAPDVDSPFLLELLKSNGIESQWHPIDIRKMDTSTYNNSKKHSDRRIIHYFKSSFPLPLEPNLHIALLHYVSDRNSLFTVLNVLDNPGVGLSQLASLSHYMVIHDLSAIADDTWSMMETWSDCAADSRGLYNGRMYDKRKRLVASFVQDGVVVVQRCANL